MKLYHGSNVDIKKIDLDQCKPYKDFGKGFYLTPIYSHAHTLANARVVRYGGNAIVNVFEFNEESAINDSK